MMGHAARPTLRAVVRRPELVASLAVAGAWTIVLFRPLMPGHASHMGMAASAMSASTPLDLSRAGQALSGFPAWMVMTIAMMGPAALAGIRHTGLNSLSWRRYRAMGEFAAGYLTVWAAFGIVSLVALGAVPQAVGWSGAAAALAIAGVWELTPMKRRSLRECHRSVPLPPRGWRAEIAAIRFGLRNGTACLGSCWCLMLAMTMCPVHYVLATVLLTAVSTAERLVERPRRATRVAALSFGVLAVGVFVAARLS